MPFPFLRSRIALPAIAVVVVARAVVACSTSDDPPPAPPPDAGASDAGVADAHDDATDADAVAPFCVLGDGGRGDRPDDPPCRGVTRTVDGRPYCVNVPASLSGAPAPLVLLLHGYRSSGQEQATYFGIDAMAERYGFVAVKPDGVVDKLGNRSWNAFSSCCAAPGSTPPDDVAYLSNVVADVKSAVAIDPKRVFVIGHSNGGFMTHRLACDRADVFASAVVLAGSMDPGGCTPARPISILHVHGTKDGVIKYAGGNVPLNPSPYASAETVVEAWAKANGCSGARTANGELDLVCDDTSPGSETRRESYAGCPSGIDVTLLRMEGVGHIPSFVMPTWPDTYWQFLSAHPMP